MEDNSLQIEKYESYIERLEYENDLLKRKLEEYSDGEEESRKKIEKAFKEAEDAKRAAASAYALELKAVRNFSAKWRRAMGGSPTQTSEIIDLLKDFLVDIGLDAAKENVQKASNALSGDDEEKSVSDEQFEFDLDAAINPTGELDLAELCKELGVYRG